MITSMVVVFSPHYYFYAVGQHLSYRLSGISPLLSGARLNTDLAVWQAQMEAAFGAILRLPDRPPWPSESSDPICMAITGSLFGAGLVFLTLRMRTIATPLALLSMIGSIGLGSGFISNPPSYYHHFVGIVFVMFIVAVPLECLLQSVAALRGRVFSRVRADTPISELLLLGFSGQRRQLFSPKRLQPTLATSALSKKPSLRHAGISTKGTRDSPLQLLDFLRSIF